MHTTSTRPRNESQVGSPALEVWGKTKPLVDTQKTFCPAVHLVDAAPRAFTQVASPSIHRPTAQSTLDMRALWEKHRGGCLQTQPEVEGWLSGGCLA